jgi:hypothetical protein
VSQLTERLRQQQAIFNMPHRTALFETSEVCREAADELDRLTSAGSGAEGWVMVPRQPTIKMLQSFGHEYAVSGTSEECYRKMLAASPPPPSDALRAAVRQFCDEWQREIYECKEVSGRLTSFGSAALHATLKPPKLDELRALLDSTP